MSSPEPSRQRLETEPALRPHLVESAAGAARWKPRWWLELVYVTIFYALYSAVRNMQGSASVSTQHAFTDATRIISLEERLHVFAEHGIQQFALHFVPAIDAANIFYGTAHFVVTVGALVWLFRHHPDRYRRWRTTLAATTAAALIGFALFPVLPPRLLPARYGFVDTLARYKTLWSFDSGTMHSVSNQFAAMPSLHFAWATWVALALFPILRRRWARGLAIAYPIATALVVVTTANHYFGDLAGGVGALVVGLVVAMVVTRVTCRVRGERHGEPSAIGGGAR